MSTPEQIQAILDCGRQMPTYRIDINPDTCRYRVVIGCKIITVVSEEYDTQEEAIAILNKINKRYYFD